MLAFSRALGVALIALFLNACVGMSHVDTTAGGIIVKSPADRRDYRSVTLENGLKVMLVSDATSDRAAAALDVHVGSGHDPVDRQGLAHYLEHMLFLGTKKYPEAGEYQQYISAHGGSNNAYTVLNHTNYFFNITPDYLEGALDRFAQFFIAPRFDEQYVKRERAIVHSEYRARKDDEGRRLWKARRLLYNPAHPSTQFSVGSASTLADRDDDSVRDDLVEFYQRTYHASRMVLSVIGNQSLDQLQSWVEEKFSDISSVGEAYQPFDLPLINSSQLPAVLKLKPLKETHQLTFSFPIDSVEAYTASKPAGYLSNILGHEGEGSLLAALKARTWANSLSAGLGYSDEIQATFDIKISLSEEGFKHIDEIGDLLFSSIRLIGESGIKQAYFDELKQLADLEFRFQEQVSETALVQHLASQLHRYKPEDVLQAPYRYERFDAQLVEDILSRLRPENLQLVIVDPRLESALASDWYDVKYQVDKMDAQRIARWGNVALSEAIVLPLPNPFIPEQLTLLKPAIPEVEIPQKIESSLNVQIWHQNISRFEQPKAELYFTLRSNVANASPRQAMLTELYVQAVEEAMNAFSYPAYLAGLEYRIYRHSRGLSVRISGYADRQAALLNKIVDTMLSLDLEPSRFALHVENIKRSLENNLMEGPSDRVIDGVYDILLSSSWSIEEKLFAIKEIDLSALEAHISLLLAEPDMLVLSVGNVSQSDSLRAGNVVSRLFAGDAIQRRVPRARVRKLPAGKLTLKVNETPHDDAALALVFQGNAATIEELAATQMLGALIHSPYYQTLRTEAQVGYIVSAFAFNLLDAPALGFSVQSNTHSVSDVFARTEAFLSSYAKALIELSDDTYKATQAGLIARILKEETQLSDVASRYWAELDRQAHAFDTREKLVEAIRRIDKDALLDYFERMINGEQSAGLLSFSFGKQSKELDLPAGRKTQQFSNLALARRALKQHF